MENFTFYSPTYFAFGKGKEILGAKEEDIPKLVDVLCNGDGRTGSISGFVTLDTKDCTEIYKMMVR